MYDEKEVEKVKQKYIFLSIVVVSINLIGMEKKIIPLLQKKIIIPCIDKEYELEKWKVLASNSLYKHCLQYNKNFESIDSPITVSKIPISYEKMDLFSKTLDQEPQLFETYFNHTLTPDQRRSLIIMVGKRDENKKRQFNCPGLIAQIFNTCFPEDWKIKNIKPLLERFSWVGYCYKKVVENNLNSSFFPSAYFFDKQQVTKVEKIYNDGKFNLVPLCLAKKDSICDLSQYKIKKQTIDNSTFQLLRYKEINNNWQHCISFVEPTNSLHQQPDNQILLWAINNHTNYVTKTIIKHKHPIEKYFFSNNGEYAITQSKTDLFISKFIYDQKNESYTFDTYRVDHDEYLFDVCCNDQSTHLVSSSASNNRCGVVKLLNMSGICIADISGVEFVHKLLLNPESNKLVILSEGKEHQKYILICTVTNNKIQPIKKISVPDSTNKRFDRIICSPNGNYWAITTKQGGIIFLATFTDSYRFNELIKNSITHSNMELKILFSSDSAFLITMVEKDLNKGCIVEVWSTRTGEKIVSQPAFIKQNMDYSIGLTPKDREFVIFLNFTVYKRPFINEIDDTILQYLSDSISVYELYLLRRLYLAHINKDTVQLYEEEPAHKALIHLPQKTLLVAEFIRKYLSWKTINNKKGIAQLIQETWKNIFS